MQSTDTANIHRSRRQFLQSGGIGLGAAALASLLDPASLLVSAPDGFEGDPSPMGSVTPPAHFEPRATSVIYLFMHGGPSQIDLFDCKPRLLEWQGRELPASVRGNQRLTGMTSNQGSLPLVASSFSFA